MMLFEVFMVFSGGVQNGSVMHGRHVSAACRARVASLDTAVHAVEVAATVGTCLADLGTYRAKAAAVSRAAELEICRDLTEFGAIDHQAKVIGFDMLSSHREAMRHCHLQAGLMTFGACINARLHA
jgi:hypothetical protein